MIYVITETDTKPLNRATTKVIEDEARRLNVETVDLVESLIEKAVYGSMMTVPVRQLAAQTHEGNPDAGDMYTMGSD